MTQDFVWPPSPQHITEDFLGTGVPVYHQMYGSLDENSDFSRVSVANIGFSLDATKGCPLRCSYCVRLSNKTDGLFDEQVLMKNQKVFNVLPLVVVPGDKLVDALVTHPAFMPNESVITVSTGSSEAFAPNSEQQTFKILHTLRNKFSLRNPVWIVTKLGIPRQFRHIWKLRLTEFARYGTIVISVTSSGLPASIESHQADRFEFVSEMLDTGVYFSHHLRPIIAQVNDSEATLRAQLARSLLLVRSVCVGGLRLDPGIKIAWQDINGLDPNLLPHKPGEKDLPTHVLPTVRRIMDELGYTDTPLFLKSSHVIAHARGTNDHCLSEYQPKKELVEKGCILSIPVNGNAEQVAHEVQNLITASLKKLKLSSHLVSEIKQSQGKVELWVSPPDLLEDYRIHKVLIQTLGHYNNLTNVLKTDINTYWRQYER